MEALLVVIAVAGMFLLLIAPHEAGHFALAKLFKVRVIEFSIGAGTKLWSTTRGGTLYAIRAIPVIGYVRMGGMEAGDFEDPSGFHHKTAWQRILILAAGPAANFVVAILLFTGLGLTQLNDDVGKVARVVPNSPAADSSRFLKDIERIAETYQVDSEELADAVRHGQAIWQFRQGQAGGAGLLRAARLQLRRPQDDAGDRRAGDRGLRAL